MQESKLLSLEDDGISATNKRTVLSGIKFVTPAQRHIGQDQDILKNRKSVYEAAKLARPDRWRPVNL